MVPVEETDEFGVVTHTIEPFRDFLAYCEGDRRGAMRYLKDWHFFQKYREYRHKSCPIRFFREDECKGLDKEEPVYRLPAVLDLDWLNKNPAICRLLGGDYRFVYFGVRGTWFALLLLPQTFAGLAFTAT